MRPTLPAPFPRRETRLPQERYARDVNATAVVVASTLGTIGKVLLYIVGAIVLVMIVYLVYGSLPGTTKRRNARYQAGRDRGKSQACIAGAHAQCPGCECSCHPKPKLSLECGTLGRHERCAGTLPNTHEPCECSCHRRTAPLPPPTA
jgi:hypothetical protein